MSRQAQSKRGFTLVEVIAAIAALSVLVMAMGGILVFMLRGEAESFEHADSFSRVDSARMLIVEDYRKGMEILFPASDGSDGSFGVGDQQVVVNVIEFAEGADVGTEQHVRWWYDADQETLYREFGTWNGVAFTVSEQRWTQTNITAFEVTRNASNDLSFLIRTLEADSGLTEEVEFSVGLRNTD